jgi:hypothetical protein
MNREENDNDILRKFLDPSKSEKAPEGFTLKTMARITIERQSVSVKESFFVRNKVPLLSAAVIIILITVAVLIPAGENGNLGFAAWSYLRDLKINLPQINNTYLKDFALPYWTKYGLVALAALIFFDRALFSFFSRRDNPR